MLFTEVHRFIMSAPIRTRTLAMGTRVSRGVEAGHAWSGWKGARTVAPRSSEDPGHRFGGPRPPADPPGTRDGAWYGALSQGPGRGTPGLLLERQWYYAKDFSPRHPIPLAVLQAMDAGALDWAEVLWGRLLVDYRLRTAIEVADLSWGHRRPIFSGAPLPGNLQRLLEAAGYRGLEHAFSSDDYTVSRAVSHAIRDRHKGLYGLVCESMRETSVHSGENLVLFGADTQELEVLDPLTEWQVTEVPRDGRKPTIRAKQVSAAPHPSPGSGMFSGV